MAGAIPPTLTIPVRNLWMMEKNVLLDLNAPHVKPCLFGRSQNLTYPSGFMTNLLVISQSKDLGFRLRSRTSKRTTILDLTQTFSVWGKGGTFPGSLM